MNVYVNGEMKGLHVYDRTTGADYAKAVVCAQEQLETGPMGEFMMTEEEYQDWKNQLAVLQESEDIRYRLKDLVDEEELNRYLYEDTMYLVHIRETIEGEHYCLKELETALEEKNVTWLKQHRFDKVIEGLV